MKVPDSSILFGDGRKKIQPVNVPEGTYPMSVGRGIARTVCRVFERAGFSNHSAQGNLVWLLVTYCLEREIPYEIETHVIGKGSDKGQIIGYTIRRKE